MEDVVSIYEVREVVSVSIMGASTGVDGSHEDTNFPNYMRNILFEKANKKLWQNHEQGFPSVLNSIEWGVEEVPGTDNFVYVKLTFTASYQ